MILMKEYVSLTTAAMKIDKRHFHSDHSNGCYKEKCSIAQFHIESPRAYHPYLMDFFEFFSQW